jgi:predicted dehydrogenase
MTTESEQRRARAAFIGCGGHATRSIMPSFQYAPIELVAVCDLVEEKARRAARQFGAERWYTDHREMLDREQLDAVYIVTSYDEQGRPRYPALSIECMRSGRHVWIEKPPASSVAEIEEMRRVSRETGKHVVVGFKKMFFPTVVKVKAILDSEEFGSAESIYLRYPQGLPPDQDRREGKDMVGVLDHIVHPGSILVHLMGPIERVCFDRSPNGDAVILLRFTGGGVGTLHMPAAQSPSSPLERLEVAGRGHNVVVENMVRLTYYRHAPRGPFGDFIGPDDGAPITWEPEFSLSQIYNKILFLQGYVQEVSLLAQCALDGTAPPKAGLDDALEILKLYEALREPCGAPVAIPREAAP